MAEIWNHLNIYICIGYILQTLGGYMTVGDCLCFEYIYICIGYILPTIGGYIKNFHGVKLSAVPNCPFWHMVPNCPVPNYSGSKLSVNMGGAKLSWCQIVLGPTVLLVLYKFAIKYENINLKICWMLILNFCHDMDLSESSRSSSQWAGSSFLDRIVRGLCCLYQFCFLKVGPNPFVW